MSINGFCRQADLWRPLSLLQTTTDKRHVQGAWSSNERHLPSI